MSAPAYDLSEILWWFLDAEICISIVKSFKGFIYDLCIFISSLRRPSVRNSTLLYILKFEICFSHLCLNSSELIFKSATRWKSNFLFFSMDNQTVPHHLQWQHKCSEYINIPSVNNDIFTSSLAILRNCISSFSYSSAPRALIPASLLSFRLGCAGPHHTLGAQGVTRPTQHPAFTVSTLCSPHSVCFSLWCLVVLLLELRCSFWSYILELRCSFCWYTLELRCSFWWHTLFLLQSVKMMSYSNRLSNVKSSCISRVNFAFLG